MLSSCLVLLLGPLELELELESINYNVRYCIFWVSFLQLHILLNANADVMI